MIELALSLCLGYGLVALRGAWLLLLIVSLLVVDGASPNRVAESCRKEKPTAAKFGRTGPFIPQC